MQYKVLSKLNSNVSYNLRPTLWCIEHAIDVRFYQILASFLVNQSNKSHYHESFQYHHQQETTHLKQLNSKYV